MRRASWRITLLLGLIGLGWYSAQSIFDNFVTPSLSKPELGLSAALIGFIVTSHYSLSIVIQPVVGALSDRTRTPIGRRLPWLLVFAPLGALSFLAIPLLLGRPALLLGGVVVLPVVLAIFAYNIAIALYQAPSLALLGDLVPPERRSRVNGTINFITGVGLVITIVLSGVAGFLAPRYGPYVLGSAALLITALTALLGIREPKAGDREAQVAEKMRTADGFGALARNGSLWLALLGLLCAYMAVGATQIWLSQFAQRELGIEPRSLQFIRAIGGIMFLIAPIPAGALATRFGRKPILLGGMLFMGAFYALGLLITGAPLLIVQQAALAAGVMLFFVNALPLVYEYGEGQRARIGAITGLFAFVFNLGYALGPQLAGVLIDQTRHNYYVLFAFSAAAMAVGAALLFFARRPTVAADAATATAAQAVETPAMTAATGEVDVSTETPA